MDYLANTRKRVILAFSILIIGIILAFILSIVMGSIDVEIKEVFQIIFSKNRDQFENSIIVWDIRLPRVLATLIGGSALAISGLLLQVFFRNPIVEPYVLGISSGATLGVALVMLGGWTLGAKSVSSYTLFAAAFIGAMISTLIAVGFSTKVKNVTTLLLVGIMMGYITSALTRTLSAFADKEKLTGFYVWTMGSFSGFTWKNIKALLIIGIPGLLLTFLIVKPLNAFLMGEEYAESMGVNIKLFRFVIVAIASLLTAVTTAFAGPIAFVGMAVPHLTRILFGRSDNKLLVPGTILLGGIVTCLCDLVARTIFAPIELPISAVTSLFGAPLVIFLIVNNKKENSI